MLQSRMRNGALGVAAAAWLLAVPAPAGAQAQPQGTLEDRLRTQLRALNAQNQQMQAERATLQATLRAAEEGKAAVARELAEARAELEASRGRAQGLAARQRQVEESAAERTRQADAARDEQQRTARGLQQQLAAMTQERGRALDAQRERDAQLERCGAMNARLQSIGKEILDAYEHFDVADAVAFRHPFAAGARVKLETQAQVYGDALYENKFDPRGVAALSVPSAAPSAASPAAPSAPSAPVAAGAAH